MFKKSFLILLTVILCPFAFADDKKVTEVTKSVTEYVIPEQKIVGADTPFIFGEVVDIAITDILEDKKPKNLVSYSTIWRISEVVVDQDKNEIKFVERKFKDYVDNKNRKGIFFPAGVENKKLFVEAVVTYLYVDVDKDNKPSGAGTKTAILKSEVIVGNGKFYTKPNPKPDPDPRPFPNPNPDPKPDPDPQPSPVAEKLFLIVLSETSSVPLDFVNFIGNVNYWQSLRDKGHSVGFFDKDSKDAVDKKYLKEIEDYNNRVDASRKVQYPALLVLEKSTDKSKNGKPLEVANLPKNTVDMDLIVKRITGK